MAAIATSRERLRQWLRISLYRNALYLVMNSAITAVLGLLFWLLAARQSYHVEDLGLASAAISAILLLALLSTVGLDYGVIRFLPNSGRGANALINSCFTVSGLTSIVIALIFIAGLGFWSPALLFLREEPGFLYAFVAVTAGSTLSTLVSRTFVAKRRAGFALSQGIIFNVLRLGLLIPLAPFAAFGIFASWGIGWMVALGIGILLFLPRVQAGYRPVPTIDGGVINQVMRFASANYLTDLLWTAPALILPLMVVNRVGAEFNAYFYIAWAMANLLFSIPLNTSFSLFAEGSYDEGGLSQNAARSLRFSLLLLIPGVALILLIGERLLSLFGPGYAENATTLLRVLAVSAIPLGLNYIYFGMKRAQMKMKGVVGLTAFMAIATLALSWVLLPRMGILGAGVAWLSSQGTAALVIILSGQPPIRKRPSESTANR